MTKYKVSLFFIIFSIKKEWKKSWILNMEFRVDYAKRKKVIGTAFLSNYSGTYQESSYFGM